MTIYSIHELTLDYNVNNREKSFGTMKPLGRDEYVQSCIQNML